MLRNFAAALALILLSQSALGLGLGTLKQSSALNELFDGRIEILGTNARDLDEVIVRLADSEQFERAGVAREAVLLQLKFKIVDGGARADYIQITSREPIREPFLNFLLELNWEKGRMVREYTALLDPPPYDPVRRQVAAPPVAATPAPAVVAPTPPAVTTTESAAPIPSMSSTTMVEPTAPAAYAGDSTLRPVVVNDTLWSIASANLPNNATSIQQMMLAPLRANPEAFGANNINILKRGSILRLPDEAEINAMSRAEAIAEVQRHHQLWSDYRDVATETVAEAPIGQPSADTEPMDDAGLMADPEPSEDAEPMADIDDLMIDDEPEDTDARLELVAPGDGDEMGAGDGDDGEVDVTLAREELDAQGQENTELQARIAEANEIIDLMSRQVDIRDDELAALQARLLELGIEAPPDVLAGLDADDEPDTEMMVDDELMAEETPIDPVEMGGMDEEIPGVVDDLGEVDITIGDDADTAVGDVLPENIDQSTEESDVGVDDGGGAEPDGGGSLLGGLIPAHISNMVPGGAMTVLGILGVVLLGIIAALFKLIGGRNKDDGEDLSAVASAARDEDATSLTEGFDEEEEPITETRDVALDEYSSADTTEIAHDDDTPDIAPEMAETDVSSQIAETENDMIQTLESTAAELAGEQAVEDELEEDPLEEVNVYLAYERFDQAEELVRKVIGEYPEDHKYELRLLEVFYSASNKVAYEEAARALYDGVGESDPLWGSAVAMWTEMSPERELFAEGAAGAKETPAEKPEASEVVDITVLDEPEASEVVDITALDEPEASEVVDITALDEPGKDTMSMGPGSDAVLESTQIGLGVADGAGDDDSGSLDFDLGADDGFGGEDIFDLTATTDSLTGADGMLDLTADMDDTQSDQDSPLDLTADLNETSGSDSDVLDVSVGDSLTSDGDDVLDLTAPAVPQDPDDLLDVTKTGLITGEQTDDDLLNVTAPSMISDDDTLPVGEPLDTEGGIDFDISDTIVPAFGVNDEVAADEEGVFDITAPSADEDDDAPLDFNIGELEETADGSVEDELTLDISGGLEFDSDETVADNDNLDLAITGAGPFDPDSIATVDLEAEEPDDISEIDTISGKDSPAGNEEDAGFDLSLQSSDLDDLSIAGDTVGGAALDEDTGDESEIEFDLALEDTTEMDKVVVDETLELPKADSADESLEDLAKSMEESMADLDLRDDDLPEGEEGIDELDLSFTATEGTLDIALAGDSDDAEPSLDFDIADLDLEDIDQADTIALDLSVGDDDDAPLDQDTVALPADGAAEQQNDADEVDTKLNLAKAYIELGDNDGARSTLDEVARDGSDVQQTEAQRLLEQID